MDAEQLNECENHLYSRLPLLGRRRRRHAVEALAQDGSPQAVRLLSVAVVRSEVKEVQAAALDALRRLAGDGSVAAREALCSLALDHQHAPARDLAVAAEYAPQNPERRALFYFLTEQWQPFESLDFDSRLLRAAYAAANEKLRLRIRRKARKAGRVEWVDAVAGGRRGRPLSEMTPEEWQTTLTVLTEGLRWQDLWQLALEASLVWSARIAARLRDQGWSPTGEDRELFEELLRLAPDLEVASPGGLLRSRAVLGGHDGPVRCLAVRPDGEVLITGSEDQTVRVWSPIDGKLLRVLLGHEGPVRRLALSPDGEMLASASRDGTVRVWRLAHGSVVATLTGHRGAVTALAVSPDGEVLASGGEDGTVRLWRLSDGRALRTLSAHAETVNCLAVTPDGTVLASASGNFHPDYAPEDGDYRVRLWTLPAGRDLQTLAGHRNWVSCLAISPDGRILASGGSEVLIWQLPSAKRRADPDAYRLLMLSNLTGSWANCLAFSPDSRTLVSGNMDRSVGFWRLPAGGAGPALDHERAVRGAVFSPDGRVLVTAGDDLTIRVWDVAERRTLATLRGHADAVTCLALGADGKVLVSGSADGTARVWTSDLERLSRLPVGRIGAKDWAWIQETLRDGRMFEAERRALTYLAALLRHRRRADVIVEAAGPTRIAVGEFDVEIEA